ncbi:MAG TPA: hypothetical protein VD839_09690 [Burkholderiales bacterium]|nr:hypothetical protein [Burkholderiales bacterium]
MLGGFAAITGLITLDSMISAIREKFSGKVAEGNAAAAIEAHRYVIEEKKQVATHA